MTKIKLIRRNDYYEMPHFIDLSFIFNLLKYVIDKKHLNC